MRLLILLLFPVLLFGQAATNRTAYGTAANRPTASAAGPRVYYVTNAADMDDCGVTLTGGGTAIATSFSNGTAWACASSEPGAGGPGTVDFLGDFASPATLTLVSGSADVTTGGGAGAYLIAGQGGVADDWTAATCAAGVSFSVRAASDAVDITIVSTSIPTPTDSDLTLDQDGDLALVICQTANTPEVILFVDEDGKEFYNALDGGKVPLGTTVRPAGSLDIQITRHANECGSLMDGLDGMKCYQESNHVEYHCLTADALCNSWAEWKPAGDGAAGDIEVAFPQEPTLVDLSSDAGTFASAIAYAISAQGVATTDNWTAATCTTDFSVRRDSVDDITIVHASIPNPTGANIILNEDGDRAWMTCDVANTPVVDKFYDASTRTLYENAAGGLSSPVGISDGGTGQTTKTNAMDALSPTTTKGDLLVDNGTNVIRVAVGATNGHVLTVDSVEASGVKWAAAGGSLFTLIDSDENTTAVCDGGSTAASLLSISIPAGTLAAGDHFVIQSSVTVTGAGSNVSDAYIRLGSTVQASVVGIDDNGGATFRFECTATTLTAIRCVAAYGYDTFGVTDSSIQQTVSDLSANALAIDLMENNCPAGTMNGNNLYAYKVGI